MRNNAKRASSSSLINDLWQLISYISPRRRRQLGGLFVLIILSSLSEVVSLGSVLPFLQALSNPEQLLASPRFQSLFNFFKIESAQQLVLGLAVTFIVTAIVANSMRLITLKVQLKLAAVIGSDLSCQIYQTTLRQPYSFFAQHNSSDLMQTLVDDLQRVSLQVLMPLLAFFTNNILSLSLIIALVFIDARIAAATAITLGGTYVFIFQMRKRLLRKNSQQRSQSSQRRIRVIQESIGGIRDVLIAHTQDFFQQSYQEAEVTFRDAQATNTFLSQSPKFLVEAITMTAIALLALALGRDGDFSQVVPIMGGLALGAKRLLPALQSVFYSLAQIQGARASLVRALAALQRSVDPLLMQPFTAGSLPLEQELKLENVWFRYSDEQDWILKNLNIVIEAKTTVGFVGSTGSGKSTTADLVLGLLQPQKGTLWVDGRSIEGDRLRQWQQTIAHVPQSIFLTDASIAENIAFAVPKQQIDFEQVRKAAKLAQIDNFIEELPAKYETYVGERGVRLSGGQRQRIGIARALYRQATVIVLDEATSALDNATEKEVMAAINELSHQFTIILIAHRLSTVEKCDKIFELHKGQVLEQGTYKELLENSKSFKKMILSGT